MILFPRDDDDVYDARNLWRPENPTKRANLALIIVTRNVHMKNVDYTHVSHNKYLPLVLQVLLPHYEGKAKSLWTFLITFIIDVQLFSYFHKCNNGLLSTFM